MHVIIFDYGAGNIHSLNKALVLAGADARIERDPARCVGGDILVLPGVGAYQHAAAQLEPARLAIRDAILDGMPTLGICLGMQLLFMESDEGPGLGLGVIAGRVERLRARRIPQIGWNSIETAGDEALAVAPLRSVFYANSFVARPTDESCVTAWTSHEADRFPAIVRCCRAIGVQFHPEKSSAAGISFLGALLQELGAKS